MEVRDPILTQHTHKEGEIQSLIAPLRDFHSVPHRHRSVSEKGGNIACTRKHTGQM